MSSSLAGTVAAAPVTSCVSASTPLSAGRWSSTTASTTQLTRLWLSSPRSAGSPIIARTFPIRGSRAAMEALRASSAPEVVKDVLLFIVLTAARLSEATGAVWSEIHFDDRVWTLSPDRMKAGREHEVPLSAQAIELLRRRQREGQPGPFVFRFRSSRGRLRPVTGESLNYWLRKLDLRDSQHRPVVTHGFRTTFRVWTVEVDDASSAVGEAALAHLPSSRTEAAYRRTKAFDKRQGLMQRWADYVVPLSSRLTWPRVGFLVPLPVPRKRGCGRSTSRSTIALGWGLLSRIAESLTRRLPVIHGRALVRPRGRVRF